MNEPKTINFYFNPIIIPLLFVLTMMMMIPIWNLFFFVESLIGYCFVVIMTIITICLIYRVFKYLLQLIKKKPALILSDKKLFIYQLDKTIDWVDIEEFKVGGQKANYISIKFKDNEKYISLISNAFKKIIYRIISKLFHGTFTFSVSILKGNNEKIFETLENHLKMVNNDK